MWLKRCAGLAACLASPSCLRPCLVACALAWLPAPAFTCCLALDYALAFPLGSLPFQLTLTHTYTQIQTCTQALGAIAIFYIMSTWWGFCSVVFAPLLGFRLSFAINAGVSTTLVGGYTYLMLLINAGPMPLSRSFIRASLSLWVRVVRGCHSILPTTHLVNHLLLLAVPCRPPVPSAHPCSITTLESIAVPFPRAPTQQSSSSPLQHGSRRRWPYRSQQRWPGPLCRRLHQ